MNHLETQQSHMSIGPLQSNQTGEIAQVVYQNLAGKHEFQSNGDITPHPQYIMVLSKVVCVRNGSYYECWSNLNQFSIAARIKQ